jgi:hypothetical protein
MAKAHRFQCDEPATLPLIKAAGEQVDLLMKPAIRMGLAAATPGA